MKVELNLSLEKRLNLTFVHFVNNIQMLSVIRPSESQDKYNSDP